MNFGEALEALKNGERVARSGWNGKGMYLYLVSGSEVEPNMLRGGSEAALHAPAGENGMVRFGPHIDMVSDGGDVWVGWNASQTDMLSDDWQIIVS